MAAKTPDSVIIENFGTMTLHKAVFSTNDIDDGDTWTTKIPSIVGQWANPTDDPTQENEGIDVGLTTATTGVLTFYAGENNRTADVYILSRT